MYIFNFILLFFLCSCNEPEIVNPNPGHKQSPISDCTAERAQVNSLRTTLKNLIKDNKEKVNYINKQQIDYEKQVKKAFPKHKNFTKFTATKSTIKVDTKILSCSEMAQEISTLNSNIDLLKADNQKIDTQIEDQKTYFEKLLEKNHQENLKTNPKAKKPALNVAPAPKSTVIEKPTPPKPKTVVAKTTPTSPSGHLGLDNKGNTCFLNSTTQMLFEALAISNIEITNFNDPKYNDDVYADDGKTKASSSKERQAFLKALKDLKSVRDDPSKQADLDTSLKNYFAAYEAVNKKVNKTQEVGGEGGGYVGKDQCDALDYLRSVLDFIGYQLTFQEIYKVDNKNRINEIKDNVLSFTVGELDNSKKYNLSDLYENWKKPEEIEWINEEDKTKTKAMKSINFSSIQRNFFIALKRFLYVENYIKKNGEKLNTIVIPDKNLNIQTRTGEGSGKITTNHHKAFLKSIVVQTGGTDGGHYYSYVYDEKEKKWFKYNDSSVTEISEKKVMDDASKNGYLFSYELTN